MRFLFFMAFSLRTVTSLLCDSTQTQRERPAVYGLTNQMSEFMMSATVLPVPLSFSSSIDQIGVRLFWARNCRKGVCSLEGREKGNSFQSLEGRDNNSGPSPQV